MAVVLLENAHRADDLLALVAEELNVFGWVLEAFRFFHSLLIFIRHNDFLLCHLISLCVTNRFDGLLFPSFVFLIFFVEFLL